MYSILIMFYSTQVYNILTQDFVLSVLKTKHLLPCDPFDYLTIGTSSSLISIGHILALTLFLKILEKIMKSKPLLTKFRVHLNLGIIISKELIDYI